MNGYFITGTDTGCGKTEVTLLLMRRLQQRGLRVQGMKPVASGGVRTAEGLRNEDALRIQAQGSDLLPYEQINPYCYEPPIAPHLAAAQAGAPIRPEPVVDAYERIAEQADRVLVEGVGGWCVPLGDDLMLADLAGALRLPVILVAGLRLGCLNHALLSAEAILNSGCELAGWVANVVDSQMPFQAENIATLERLIPAPRLASAPYGIKDSFVDSPDSL